MKPWIIAIVLASVAYFSTTSGADKKVVCYYGTWAGYRPDDGKFEPENIDPNLCTHIVYAFVGADTDGSVKLLDPYNDIGDNYGKNFIGRVNALKEKNPALKTVVSYGGWNEGSQKMSTITNNPTTRAAFAKNAAEFAKKYGFDGFDMDWEYPCQRGGQPSDKEAFVELLKEMRPIFDSEGLTISAAVAAGKASIDMSYDVAGIAQYLDWITVMAFDFHGQWESVTGENAPLDAGSGDPTLNVKYAVQYWMQLGAPAEKIVMGMGTYGRSFTLASAQNHDIGAQTLGGGEAGPFTRERGTLGYNEICINIQNSGWTETWFDEQEVPYAYKGDQWVGFDNPRSLQTKVTWGLEQNLAGFMIWSIETDDFHGRCNQGAFPLLNAINAAAGGHPTTKWTTAPTQSTTPTKPGETTTTQAGGAPTTTTEASTGGGSGDCTAEGFFRYANDCSKYYECVRNGDTFLKYDFSCPAGTIFDNVLHICELGTC